MFPSLEQTLTLEGIRTMVEPERVACLNVAFAGNDQIKANAAPICKTRSITSFKTV